MTRRALGGIRESWVAAPATIPQASPLWYPLFTISGMASLEKVTAQARLDPLTALKKATAKVVAMAKPPGSRPTQRYMASYILVGWRSERRRGGQIGARAPGLQPRQRAGAR